MINRSFLSGTRNYIDGTKNVANIKKQLRFQLPHTPLKVLRGEKDEEDVRDKYHERFQAPGTSTEDEENYRDIDDESRRSSLSRDGVMTDIGEVSDEGMERYLGRDTSSIEGVDDNSHKNHGDLKNVDNIAEHDTTGSVNLESADDDNHNHNDDDNNNDNNNDNASGGEGRHLDRDDLSASYQTTDSVSEEAIELQDLAQAPQPPNQPMRYRITTVVEFLDA